ncbi:MAG: tricarballylate dehydrogenase [Betaproteobacteria bacterium RIFCSPLOWO2_02_64_14]|jgi:tricarballylate dehydrogenase|nr:MAG: tricarballylate dehydrogenase [Betaproteobacteria bacterium RIFCSPLOWO2_02_64_14]
MKQPYDVIVVGGGNAALCAALSAREHGARVLLIERAPEHQRGGNSAFTGGGFRMVHHGVEDVKKVVPDLSEGEIANTDFGEYTAEQYLDDLGRVTQYYCDPDLAETVVRQSADTVQWLHGRGVRFVPRFGRYAFKHEGRFRFFGGTVVEATGGGRGLVEAEYKAAERHGVDIRYQVRATALMRGRYGVEGVRIVAEGIDEDLRARAVVLACGGFEANREWRTRYLGPGWDMAKVRGTRYNTGDGIRMALDIGAQSYGQWSGCHSVSWERNAPDFGELEARTPFSRNGYPFSIMVNAEGMRFVDEGADFRNYTYAKYGRAVLEQPGSYAWHVFDAQVAHLLHDEYKSRGATKVQADTLEELAARMEDVHPGRFLQTVREFNAAVRREVPFDPNIKDGRRTEGLAIDKSNWANPLEQPPFVAYSVTCGITFTFGGLKIDTATRVLDVSDAPLPGLYAAGELVGGLFYYNYPGSSGLMAGSVFGRIAGRESTHHARRAQSQAA